MNEAESAEVTSLFHILSDIERVADHAENIAELADIMRAEDLTCVDAVAEELQKMSDVTIACYNNSIRALKMKDKKLAQAALDAEADVDRMKARYRSRHINRLSADEYSVRSGVIFLEMLNNLERITDHSKNIAETVLKPV